jgi:hypothetical protein
MSKYNWNMTKIVLNTNQSNPVKWIYMTIHSPHAYRQMVLDCVSVSQRVEGQYDNTFTSCLQNKTK